MTRDVWRLVYSGPDASGPQEPMVIRALLCERFGVLPSQLADEPVDELFEVAKILSLKDRFQAEKRGRGDGKQSFKLE